MDIMTFCNPEDIRERLRGPFKIGTKVVCSDGCSLVSTHAHPAFSQVETIYGPVAEKINDVFAEISAAEFKPMPKVEMPEPCACEICEGTGKAVKEDCRECHGFGEVCPETDYNSYPEVECKSCRGEGVTVTQGGGDDCPYCRGTGMDYPRHHPIAIDGIHINAILLSRIIDEPNLMVKTTENKLLFKTGEYSGAIMALRV